MANVIFSRGELDVEIYHFVARGAREWDHGNMRGWRAGASSLGLDQWRYSEAEIVLLGSDPGDGLVLEDVAVLSDGSVITREEASRLPEDGFSEGSWVLPAGTHGTWLAREAGLLVTLSAAWFVGATAIVRKRRPL